MTLLLTLLRNEAERRGIPLRTLDDVKATLAQAKKNKADASLARLMCKHGRITDEALLWIGDNYPSVWDDM